MRQGGGEINQKRTGRANLVSRPVTIPTSRPMLYRSSTARRLAARPAPSTLTK
jgi:hypothetical protein